MLFSSSKRCSLNSTIAVYPFTFHVIQHIRVLLSGVPIFQFFIASLKPYTVCPRRSDPFYIVSYYIRLVTTSWTYNKQFEALFRH